MKTVKMVKTPKKRWLMIHVVMPTPEEINRGMEIATTFEDRHGGHPPMYFARYSEDNTIRISVITNQDNRKLKRHFNKLGVHSVKITDRDSGSWEHCHAYQLAKQVFGKSPKAVADPLHWVFNMCNYTYLQEVTTYMEIATWFMTNIVSRPGEKPQATPAA